MAWGPLRSGFLSGKYSSSTTGAVDTTRAQLVGAPSTADYAVIDVLNEVAHEVGASSAAVALAWILGRPGITSTLLGARRLDQLQANLAALDLTLTDTQRATLDEVSTPSLNFPAHNNRNAIAVAAVRRGHGGRNPFVRLAVVARQRGPLLNTRLSRCRARP